MGVRWGSTDSLIPTPLVGSSLSTRLPPSLRVLNSQSQDQPTHLVTGVGQSLHVAPPASTLATRGQPPPPSLLEPWEQLVPIRAPSMPLSAACPPKGGPHLRMAPRSQRLPAALTAQARPVPVFAQRRHLLGWEGERAVVTPRPWQAPPPGRGWAGHSPK